MPRLKKKDKIETEELLPETGAVEEVSDDQFDYPEYGQKKKSKKGLIAFLLFLVIAAGIFSVFFFNIFNVRTFFTQNVLGNIPVVKNLVTTESGESSVPTKSREELQQENDQLNNLLSQRDNQIEGLLEEIEEQTEEINRLRVFEEEQLTFREEKDEFDQMVAMGDPAAYSTFYESIYPETAEQLYVEATLSVEDQKKLKKYVQIFDSMGASAAADIITQMMKADMDLVVLILNNINIDQTAKILAAMEAKDASRVSMRMAPENRPE